MGRSSAGQRYKCWSLILQRNPSEQFPWHACLVQVFFLQKGYRPKEGASDSAEHNRLIERIARAFCLALCPHLKLLKEDGMAKLGLRITFESQEVSEPIYILKASDICSEIAEAEFRCWRQKKAAQNLTVYLKYMPSVRTKTWSTNLSFLYIS